MKKHSTNQYFLDVDDILKIFSGAFIRKEDVVKISSNDKIDLNGNQLDDVKIIHRNIFMILNKDVDIEIMSLIEIIPNARYLTRSICHATNFYISEPSKNYSSFTNLSGIGSFEEFIDTHVFFSLDKDIGIIVDLDDDKASYFKMKYL